MPGWYRRLPPRVRGWTPYVGRAATAMVLTGVLGFVAGVERNRIAGPWLALESLALTALSLGVLLVAAAVEATVSVHLV